MQFIAALLIILTSVQPICVPANQNTAAHKTETLAQWRQLHRLEIEGAIEDQKVLLETALTELGRWNASEQAIFGEWLGTPTNVARHRMQSIIRRELALNSRTTIDNFEPASPSEEEVYAYVYSDDSTHTIYLDQEFWRAPATGADSKAGTLCHEMSHFISVAGTDDLGYGTSFARALARHSLQRALHNADNIEFYVESAGTRN